MMLRVCVQHYRVCVRAPGGSDGRRRSAHSAPAKNERDLLFVDGVIVLCVLWQKLSV
jgi:hypothetical protein